MANIKMRPATGFYEYRRVVPERLRRHLPPVEGFTDKPGRMEFTQSLTTSSAREANRKAAILDRLIDNAFTEAERRANTAGTLPDSRPGLIGGAYVVLDPDLAFAAFERWLTAAKQAARVEIFNTVPGVDLSEAAHLRSKRETALNQPAPWLRQAAIFDPQAHAAFVETGLDLPRTHPFVNVQPPPYIPDFDAHMLAALATQRVRLSAEHPALPRLRPAFAACWRTLVAFECRLRDGAWDHEPTIPDGANPVATASTPTPSRASEKTLTQAVADYLGDTPMRDGSRRDVEMIVARLAELVGPDVAIAAITTDDIRAFRDLVRCLPARPSRAQRAMPLQALAAANQDAPVASRLSQRTINKWFDLLSAAFEHAQKHGHIGFNPVRALKVSKKRLPDKKSVVAFPDDKLETIYTSPLLTGCLSVALRHRHIPGTMLIKDARYWLALIGLYTGARINEIGQCYLTDVKTERARDGRVIDVLWITTLSDDDEDDTDMAKKELKTLNSKRPVPIHPVLVRFGFLGYVADLRRRAEIYLFPDLPHGGPWGPTKEISRWFGRYFDRIGISNRALVFHSLRHNFKSACRGHMSREIHQRLTGHSRDMAGDDYGDVDVGVLYDAIVKVWYPIASHRDATLG